MTTQGTTLVRKGMVTAFSLAAAVSSTANPGSQTRAAIAVSFEDGSLGRYEFDADPGVRTGDKVVVSENRGKVQILRQ